MDDVIKLIDEIKHELDKGYDALEVKGVEDGM